MAILEVEGLTTGYRKHAVIEDITFQVREGGFLGIIGPNGAGKSTLFKALSRTLPAWQGRIRVRGKDIHHMARRDLARHMAAVPQFMTPFPYRVEEFVRMGRYPHRGRFGLMRAEDRRIVQEVVARMELADLRDQRLNALSGGELQRVFLAQGLAQETELLLLDEPTAHLDIGHQVKIMDIIRGFSQARGLTVVMILHDLNLAGAYCDELLLLHQGKVITQGPPADVLTRERIETVYGAPVEIRPDPLTARPRVAIVPAWVKPG